jgi:hypothetical protein
MSNYITTLPAFDSLDEIYEAFDSLALIASESDSVDVHHIVPIMRQLNKNFATELEKLEKSIKETKA